MKEFKEFYHAIYEGPLRKQIASRGAAETKLKKINSPNADIAAFLISQGDMVELSKFLKTLKGSDRKTIQAIIDIHIKENTISEGNKEIEVEWDMGNPKEYGDDWQDQGVYLDNWNKNKGTITLNGDEKDLLSWLTNDYGLDKKDAQTLIRKGKKVK